MNWLRPSDHDPADILRWVRRVELAFVPFAVILAAVLLLKGSELWWVGFASAGLGLIAAAPMGPIIRRAEERTTLVHPETWAGWRRRAERLTAVTFAVLAALAVTLAFVVGGWHLGVPLAAMFVAASAGASAVRRLAGRPRR